jgi:phosphopantothenate-cysteine ligase
MLFKVEFTSVTQYLNLLETISRTLYAKKVPTIMFLAAAVSDFYLPEDTLTNHKI